MIRIARSVAAALALIVAAPTVALADAAPGAPPAAPKADKDGKRGKEKHFPMKAATFKEHVEKRIGKAKSKLSEALDRNKVPEATRASIMKDFDAGAASVRTATDRVSKDGQVTQDEAKEVRDLAKDLKQKMREKYGLNKGKGKGKDKGKGKNKV